MSAGDKLTTHGTVFEKDIGSAKCQPGLHLVPISYSASAGCRVLATYTERNPSCLCVQNGPNPLAGIAAIEQGFGNEFAEQVVGYFIFGTPFTDAASFSGSAMSLRIMENATGECR
jgi:hypothetical protein